MGFALCGQPYRRDTRSFTGVPSGAFQELRSFPGLFPDAIQAKLRQGGMLDECMHEVSVRAMFLIQTLFIIIVSVIVAVVAAVIAGIWLAFMLPHVLQVVPPPL